MPQVIARCLSAWNNSLQKVPVTFLKVWDEIGIFTQRNDQHLLPRVSARIAMFQDIQKAAFANGDNDLLK